MVKVSDYVAKFIAEQKVKHVFLLPGGGSQHLIDSIGRREDLIPVCSLHEQAAAIGADAYSQYTNQLGVAVLTTGPGGTNAITGVVASYIDSIPVLLLSGQVKTSNLMTGKGLRQLGVQEVDIVSIVKPVTKYAVTVTDPKTIRYHLEKALYLAQSGRKGPVWIDLPLDVQGALVDDKTLEGFLPPLEEKDSEALDKKVKAFIELLNQSERPALIAGNGIRLAGGLPVFRELISSFNAPILTAWKSNDYLPEDHPLYFGRPGAIGQRGANFIQQTCDLLICIGTRLDLLQVGYNYKNFAPRAKKIIVDIDPAEINKCEFSIEISIVDDAKRFLEAVSKVKKSIVPVDRTPWLDRCRNWKTKYPVILPEYRSKNSPVNTYVLVDVLSELLGSEDVLVPGSSGGCAEVTAQAFRVKEGQRILNSPGLGSMGFGLPASIGAALASGKNTVTIIGDGGLQHNIQELQTVARLNLPLKIIVLSNDGYGSIRNSQRSIFNSYFVCCDSQSGLTLPNLQKLSSAYGIDYMKISTHEELVEKLPQLIRAPHSVICEVEVERDLITAPRLSSKVMPDGSIVSKPMEDLYPFLSEEELNENLDLK